MHGVVGGGIPGHLGPAHAAGTYRGLELDPAQPRPTFTLTDTTGKPYDFATKTRGTADPAVLRLHALPRRLPDHDGRHRGGAAGDARAAAQPGPGRVRHHRPGPGHRPRCSAAWLRNFDPDLPRRFVGLTGTVAQVEAAQAAAKVPVATENGQTHSAEQLLYGPDDYARVAYVSGSTPDDLRHDLPLVAKGA